MTCGVPRGKKPSLRQKRQLLDVIAIRQPIVPQDVAVVPELLDKCDRVHRFLNFLPNLFPEAKIQVHAMPVPRLLLQAFAIHAYFVR